MRVLVTGADGFIGSHLCEALSELGHEVTALCLYNAFDHFGWLDVVEYPMSAIRGDITDPWFMIDAYQGCEPDIVYHLAAHNSIPHSYSSSHSHLMVNTVGTHNVLRASNMFGAKTVLMSSSEVYGDAQTDVMDLDHPIAPQSPYAASKMAGDLLGKAFIDSFGQEVVIMRSFNVFGPRQSARAVIPTIIKQALDDSCKKIELGNFNTSRDWTYVSDTVQAIVMASNAQSGIFQSATGVSHTIVDVARMVCDILGLKKPIVEVEDRKRPDTSEIDRLTGSYESMIGIGWRPKIKFRDGLVKTIEWFKDNDFVNNGYLE